MRLVQAKERHAAALATSPTSLHASEGHPLLGHGSDHIERSGMLATDQLDEKVAFGNPSLAMNIALSLECQASVTHGISKSEGTKAKANGVLSKVSAQTERTSMRKRCRRTMGI